MVNAEHNNPALPIKSLMRQAENSLYVSVSTGSSLAVYYILRLPGQLPLDDCFVYKVPTCQFADLKDKMTSNKQTLCQSIQGLKAL